MINFTFLSIFAKAKHCPPFILSASSDQREKIQVVEKKEKLHVKVKIKNNVVFLLLFLRS